MLRLSLEKRLKSCQQIVKAELVNIACILFILHIHTRKTMSKLPYTLNCYCELVLYTTKMCTTNLTLSYGLVTLIV